MKEFEGALPMPPTLNHFWKRSRHGGMHLSGGYLSWLKEANLTYRPKLRPKNVAAWEVSFCFVFHYVKTPKVQDLDNRLKPLIDFLSKTHAVPDHLLLKITAEKRQEKRPKKSKVCDYVKIKGRFFSQSDLDAGAAPAVVPASQ